MSCSTLAARGGGTSRKAEAAMQERLGHAFPTIVRPVEQLRNSWRPIPIAR